VHDGILKQPSARRAEAKPLRDRTNHVSSAKSKRMAKNPSTNQLFGSFEGGGSKEIFKTVTSFKGNNNPVNK